MTVDWPYKPSQTAPDGYWCETCGLWRRYNRPHICNTLPPIPPIFGSRGWVCPVCQRGVAPGVKVCPCQEKP